MKKVIIAVALVAVMVGAGFGTMATGKPPGNTVLMEAYSGTLDFDNQSGNVLWETYPGVRHISLTLGTIGIEAANGDWLLVVVRTGPTGGLFLVDLHEDDVVAVEFDAAEWTLGAGDGGGNPVHADYFYTVTYPRS